MTDEGTSCHGLIAVSGITVIVAHYGPVDMTMSLVRQLLAQDVQVPLEIIVSDDASPDPFPPGRSYRLIKSSVNGGFGAAVNRAARMAQYPLLLIMNSDIEIDAQFVSSLLEDLGFDVLDVIAGPRLVEPRGLASSLRRYPTMTTYFIEWLNLGSRWRHSRIRGRLLGSSAPTDNYGGANRWLVGAALSVPTEAFLAVGGFDERFHMYMEEVDLQRRLGSVGVYARYVSSISAFHRQGASSGPAPLQVRRIVRARRLYARKWRGRGADIVLCLVLTSASLINLVLEILRRLVGQQVNPIESLKESLRIVWQPIE